jgi:LPXTG-motif cell wall-anchored protein
VPLGGVATGDGGSRPASPLPMAMLLAGVAGVLTAGAVVFRRRRADRS